MELSSLSIMTFGTAADNVLPRRSKIAAESGTAAALPFLALNPKTIRLDQAAAGFSSVIQITANHCLRVLNEDLNLTDLQIPLSSLSLMGLLSATSESFDSHYLNKLKLEPSSLRPNRLALTFSPNAILFSDPSSVTVTYDVLVQIGRQTPSMAPGLLTFAPAATLGVFHVTFTCPYFAEVDRDLKRVDVYAQLSAATLNFRFPARDVERLYESGLFGTGVDTLRGLLPFEAPPRSDDVAELTHHMLSKKRAHLIPTLSLVGHNPSSAVVTELPDFEATVFHLSSPRQILVAAFDLKAGYRGTPEKVLDFVGAHDYGTICDEFLIDKLFKHKWRLGGFMRNLPLEETIQVKLGSDEQDATLCGFLKFTSLDVVAIETIANARTDFVFIGGEAAIGVTHLRLLDGTIIDKDKIDFGSSESKPWGLLTALRIDPAISADPVLAQFGRRAHVDAYRYIARPFANVADDVTIVYTRVEGITKQIYCVGDLDVFI
jgi:hypothetical protein